MFLWVEFKHRTCNIGKVGAIKKTGLIIAGPFVRKSVASYWPFFPVFVDPFLVILGRRF